MVCLGRLLGSGFLGGRSRLALLHAVRYFLCKGVEAPVSISPAILSHIITHLITFSYQKYTLPVFFAPAHNRRHRVSLIRCPINLHGMGG